jgi:hypothetical protein
MPFTVLEDPDGKPVTAKATEDGALRTTGEVSGPEGEALATEAEQQEQTAALEKVAGTVRTGTPIAGDEVVGVALRAGAEVIATIAPGQTATAQPEAGAEGVKTYTIGLAPAIPVGEEGTANPVTVLGVASIAGAVDQGRANPDERWSVTDTTTEAAVAAVEVELQDKALDTSVDEVESKLDTLEADKATATGQAAALAAVDEVETKLGALAAQEATTAKNTSVDGLEGQIGRRGTPADSTNVNANAGAVSGLIFSGANTLRSIDAINLGAVGLKYTLMIFNAVALPANGTAPIIRMPLPGGGSVHWDRGKNFSTGAYWAISTTDATLTVSGVANAVVDAEYGGT